MSSLSDIKASLQNNWAVWDSSGDGKLDSTDFLAAFDKNKDGSLGKDELQALADQLSTQLDYNNTLLEHMRSLEEMQLAGQRELVAKQDQVKQLTSMNEELHAELHESKRKLKITQEIADSMSKQCRDARVEANSLKREAENAAKSYQDGKDLLKELTEERARLQQELKKAEDDLHQAEENAEQERMDLLHQNDILRQSHEALSLEAAELRSKVIPIEAEKKSLKDHVLSLARSLEETIKRCEEETETRLQAEKRIKDMTHAMDALRDKHREMQYNVQQANGKADASGEAVKQLQAQVDSLDDQLRASEDKITTLTQALQQSTRDKDSLEQELEQMGNELVAHAKQRQMDQDRWAKKLANAQKEMEHAAQETKAHAEEFAMESQRRATEAIEAQRQAEEKYLAIQNECGELHSLIQQTQIDHQAALEAWEAQQEELEAQIADLERRLELSGEEVENVHSILVADREKAQQVIRAIRAEMIQRGERYVAMLGTLQTAIKRLKEDSIGSREYVREVVAQFAVLGAFCEQLWEKTHPPLEAWKVELAAAFKKLVTKFRGLKETIEDTKDDVRRAQLAKEEERSKTLMLEENVSRLEHELSASDMRIKDAENKGSDKLAQQKQKIDNLMKERADMELRLQRLQQSLDAATSQARNLQLSNHSIQTSLGDSSAKHSAVKQEVQGKLNQMAAQLKRATQERDQQAKVAEELQHKLDEMQAGISSANSLAEQTKADVEKQRAENEAIAARHASAMAAVQATTSQYQEQLKQTQELLKVVQAQRSELQIQNQKMRTELDRYLESEKQGSESDS
mmetsp:Transcript_9108/g.13709  ORF Transcript_9108/g.13709 Transcript_9108/m.13709 type:complete len:805 (-) Transcript_9108:229-2643(-)|eukprot:CAMPEP_0185029412 /NCGR_PEP_ID=MMETSP1103-20130426/15706_1 /TAXON_ID=36769 /ORGANISM="Paraphysomonas bandaiensis, Strain Caron Lab Isolate" /LENGTH=804 /DNA_ID=CAMNT_0027564145 /DNA_START=140 /DNA_END=2554 /DNA_ORIENTATION=-